MALAQTSRSYLLDENLSPLTINIRPYAVEDIPAVVRLNRRLDQAGGPSRFPTSATPGWLPPGLHPQLYQEYYVAVDGDEVRGGYILKHQNFYLAGSVEDIGDYQLPVSEGLVDKSYTVVGIQLLSDALKRQPLLYALGMGGFSELLPRFLGAWGWSIHAVPFYFMVVQPAKFLRNISALRHSRLRRLALDALAISGLGWLGITSLNAVAARSKSPARGVTFEARSEFSSWADELWEAHKHRYALVAVRDAASLNQLYPASDERFVRLVIAHRHKAIGWAVVLNTQMAGHKQFGDMRVGTLVDSFAAPENAVHVVSSAVDFLRQRDVDLIISNQSHRSWGDALRRRGFLRGPSNYLFAASKQLAARLQPLDVTKDQLHLTRGDGDGPIHL